MSKIKPGQIGDFSGKIGQVVISKWRQLTIGRSAPKKSGKNPTEPQARQRSKFGLMTSFLGKFAEAINIGYPALTGNLSARNVATSLNIRNAIGGIAPDYEIDFAKILLGNGKLNGVFNPLAESVPAEAALKVDWSINEIDARGTKPDDTVCMMVYNPDDGSSLTHQSVAKREDLTATLRLPYSYTGHEVHAWFMLIAEDGKSASRSTYLGKHLIID
ncbi:DUF6266 family protein [Pedobacter antarcticus]|uniref:DUF6266 family protein n=1 Tax=Pedobacter antarcticus TaxID=34086 RepID=UPI001C57D1D5|nr:DUF6266 family protein [Pedobacter antarcticus]